MTDTRLVSTDTIRSRFSEALSRMYRAEVPLYGDLLDIVETVNGRVLAERLDVATALRSTGEIARLGGERHGAIRLGTAEELGLMRRAFAVMGMVPVGYYDLSAAGVPVHSTAFRPIDAAALARNPFRVFTSLLRLDLIGDEALRREAGAILARRRIVTGEAVRLIGRAEAHGGLDEGEANSFVAALLETFRWHGEARIDAATYARLHAAHRLIADVVSFGGPHINHLTPRVLDIDAAQAEMARRGLGAKNVIEGPPRRAVPILLRQTSFRAVEEGVTFAGAGPGETGSHTARFGEIEQRGAALTREGRTLYDTLLAEARGIDDGQGGDHEDRLRVAFARFPDAPDTLRRQRLAFFRYAVTEAGRRAKSSGVVFADDIEGWITAGYVAAEPIVYEDFLPVSAAGIFRSNLGDGGQGGFTCPAAQDAFEQALGTAVHDPFDLYERIEQTSLAQVRAELGGAVTATALP